jgi:hypothetical protein
LSLLGTILALGKSSDDLALKGIDVKLAPLADGPARPAQPPLSEMSPSR